MSAHETTTLRVIDPARRRRSVWAWRCWAYALVAVSLAALAYQIGQGQ